MAWAMETKARIDLSHLGSDSAGTPFFVDIKNMKMLTYDEQMQLAELAPKNDQELTEEVKENLKKLFSSLVLSWNLTSIHDDTPLSIPSQDPTVFTKLPGIVISDVMRSANKITSKTDDATKNSSAPSDKSSAADLQQETSTSDATTN